MSCLLSVLEDHPKKLKPSCFNILHQRKTLWEFAANVSLFCWAKKKNSCVSGSPTDPVVLAPTVNFFFQVAKKKIKKFKKKKKKKCEVRLQRPIRFIIGDSVILLFQHGGACLLAFKRGGYKNE